MSNHELMHSAKRKALAGVAVGLCGFALMMLHGGAVSADTVGNNTQAATTTMQVAQNNTNNGSAATLQASQSTSSAATTNASAASNSVASQLNSAQAQATNTATTRAAAAPSTGATDLPQGQEYGNLDNVSYANGQLHVRGWNAVSWPADQANQDNIHHYLIVYDRTQNKQLAYQDITNTPAYRPDVKNTYPNLYKADQSGFDVDFNINSSDWLNDVIEIVSRYSTVATGNGDDGNANHKADWWSVGFYANPNNFGWLDHATFNGNTLNVSGWHATSKSYTEPNRYVIVWDKTKGTQLASIKLQGDQIQTRNDVANAYSGVYNSDKSGFDVTFDTSTFGNNYLGDQVQIVDRYSDSATGNGGSGNYTDYWSNPVTLTIENRYSFDNVNFTNDDSLHVRGWHATSLDGQLPYQFIILHDDTDNSDVAVQNVSKDNNGYVERPDVANVYPDLPGNSESGFDTILTNTSNLKYGDKYTIISRRSADGTGYGANGTHLDVTYSFTFNQHAYYIDSINPKSTSGLSITGWMASDASTTANNAYVIVLGDGREIGRQQVRLTSRPDVANTYPLIANAGNSGFSVNFSNINPSQYQTLQVVLRYTSDASGNTNGTYDDVAWATYHAANAHLDKGVFGVDVSSFQGTDLSNYARNGAQYAIVKLTEGTGYVNPHAAGQIASAKANNMMVMAYHFARFNGSVAEAQAEANYFLANASSLPKGSVLILDDEASFSGSQSANTQAAIAFMQAIQNAGYVPYIYTSSSMGHNQLNINSIESAFPNSYWVAAYPNGNGATSSPDYGYFPSNPGVVMWQYTDNWKGMGVDASVTMLPIDLNLQ